MAFEMTAEDVAKYRTTRTTAESPYQADIDGLKENPTNDKGEPRILGLFIADENRTARSIVNNLNKAADKAGIKLHIQVREKAEKPVVIFKMILPTPESGKPSATPTAKG